VRRGLIILNYLLLCSVIIFSQNKPVNTTLNDLFQWEYMVISFGKTYFDFPEKSIKYISLIDEIGQEGKNLQKNLDTLGQYGWELISIVGSIGGDQQLVLKRKIDSMSQKRDEDAQKKMNEKIKRDLEQNKKKEDEEKKALEIALSKKTVLVNIDEVEKNKKYEDIDNRIKQYVQHVVDNINDQTIIKKEIIDHSYQVELIVEYDLTSTHLENVNEYRKSLVEEFLEKKLNDIEIDINEISYMDVLVKVFGKLKFNNEYFTVGEKEVTWSNHSR
jgi:hypothetical protein